MKNLKSATSNLQSKIYNLKFLQRHSSLLVALVLLLALGLRLPWLNGSFWLDEAAQALESARPLTQQLEIAHDFQPPLMHLLVHFALYFGQSEVWLRLVGACLPGLVTIWALMMVVKEVLTQKPLSRPASTDYLPFSTSLLAGLLLASNTWHIFYSQELRPYSLPAMFGTLSWLMLMKNLKLKIKHKESKIRNSKSATLNLILLSLFTVFGLYSSYLYPMLVFSQLVYLVYLWWKQPRQRWQVKVNGTVLALAGLLFLPWLPKLAEQLQVSAQLRRSLPSWQTVVSIPQAKGLFLVLAKFVYGVLRVDVNLGWLLATLLVIGLAIKLWSDVFKSSRRRQQILPFLIWLVVPVLGSWLLSFFIPVLRPKRVLLSLPALQAVWVVLIMTKRRYLATVFLILLLTINTYSYSQYLTHPSLQREPWRQAVIDVTTQYPQKSVAVFAYPNPYSPWRWYAPTDYPTLSTGSLSINEVKDLKKTLSSTKNYRYVITFDYLTDLTDPEHKLNQQLRNFGFKEVSATAYPNLGVVRSYERY